MIKAVSFKQAQLHHALFGEYPVLFMAGQGN